MKAAQHTQHSALPNELWVRSFSYLDHNDLFRLGTVSRTYLSMSSSDSLWERHCRRRWKGKQNVSRFAKKKIRDDDDEERERGENDNHGDGRLSEYCVELMDQFRNHVPSNIPAINIPPLLQGSLGGPLHEPTSWKESYVLAEMDSGRNTMTSDELVHFQWKLVYNGRPSQMGLRRFNEDGTYYSPYMGLCEWILAPGMDGRPYLTFAGVTLLVERDDKTWGWVIGRDQRTVYLSVECDDGTTTT